MNTYSVRLTKDAEQNMQDIYDYIAEVLQSPMDAARQYNRLADAIVKLDMLPERCPCVKFEPERTRGIRRMLVDNYSVFYRVKGDEVIVLNVFYSASNLESKIHG